MAGGGHAADRVGAGRLGGWRLVGGGRGVVGGRRVVVGRGRGRFVFGGEWRFVGDADQAPADAAGAGCPRRVADGGVRPFSPLTSIRSVIAGMSSAGTPSSASPLSSAAWITRTTRLR